MEFAIKIILQIIIFLTTPILCGGIIRKVRARAQGRKGPPIIQNLSDVLRAFQKEPIDGPNSGIFAEVGPAFVAFSGIVIWSLMVFEWAPLIMIPFFLSMQRLAITGFAMETGTSFGGLGSSREILLSISSEPILILIIMVAQSQMIIELSWVGFVLGLLFLSASTVAILAELARPPFDDPRTHLELTMVHEAMLLEASGRSLALFEIGYQLKIATFAIFIVRLGLEHSKFLGKDLSTPALSSLVFFFGAIAFSIAVGYWEAVSVRRKWKWVPEIMGTTFLFLLVLGTMVKLH